MTLGTINGVSIETILQRIPDESLRNAYHHSLERLLVEHPGVLSNENQLAEFLSPTLHTLGVDPSTQTRFVDQDSFFNNVSTGRVHGDEYVAAAFVLLAVQSSSSRIRVSPALFRMNALWQEHQVLLDQFDFIREESRDIQSEGDRVSHVGSADLIYRNAQNYIRYMDSLARGEIQTWAGLETYRDAGVGTHFLDLQYRSLAVDRERESFRISHRMTPAQFQEYLDSFEAGIPKQDPAGTPAQCRETIETESVCAPNDPSCED